MSFHDTFEEFKNKVSSNKISVETKLFHTPKQSLLNAYNNILKQELVRRSEANLITLYPEAKDGLLISVAYLNIPKANDSIPFFYIITPLIGNRDGKLIFTSQNDFYSDWEKDQKYKFVLNEDELIIFFNEYIATSEYRKKIELPAYSEF